MLIAFARRPLVSEKFTMTIGACPLVLRKGGRPARIELPSLRPARIELSFWNTAQSTPCPWQHKLAVQGRRELLPVKVDSMSSTSRSEYVGSQAGDAGWIFGCEE